METENILIRRVRIVDPSRQLDRVGDLLLGGGEILATGRLGLERIPDGCRIINGAGLVASPGFIDLHCHLREPGFEYKETIAAGSRAAARGGFTTLCCMPNTDPPIDNAAVVDFIHQRARHDSLVRVLALTLEARHDRGVGGRDLRSC